ncbi:13721_t:CDS:2 [Racocetra persica]|uniref:13721_t:CDS:1 n=1 Tax=Racocetra persica TaxID=160502 RepID=A0ACA9RFQ9_9GLOM|nr:13721_t:CDS:2 [Racocetra persica]
MPEEWFNNPDEILGAPGATATEGAKLTKVKTNTRKLKDIFLVLDSTIHNLLAIGKFAQAFNFKFVDLKERFGEVIETSLPNGYKIVMFDKRVMVLKPRENKKGLEHKYETETQTNWFFMPIDKVYFGGHGKIIRAYLHADELDNATCTICGKSEKMMNRIYFEDGHQETTCDDCQAEFEQIQRHLN